MLLQICHLGTTGDSPQLKPIPMVGYWLQSNTMCRLAANLSSSKPCANTDASGAGTARSVAIIIRSERMVGRFKQHMFDLENKTVAEGWGPQQVPYAAA